MLQFDRSVPLQLRLLQEWFGAILKQPINEHSRLPKISPYGQKIEDEALHYIKPSRTLTAEKRLEIYYQQYWWRLLSTLQDIYPTLCRLFTYKECNLQLFIPYLIDNPPKHWNLNLIGKNLPVWIDKKYHEKDRQVVLAAVEIDWAFWEIFLKEKKAPLKFEQKDISELLKMPLKLQPHLHLFQLAFDFFSFRATFLKESQEHWMMQPFPELPQEKERYFFSLFRTPNGFIHWEEIEEGEFFFLSMIQQGKPIDSICKKCEQEQGSIFAQAQSHLAAWIHKWLKNELFVHIK